MSPTAETTTRSRAMMRSCASNMSSRVRAETLSTVPLREEPQEPVLYRIRVLVLVDEDIAESFQVVPEDSRVVLEESHR